MAPLRVAASPPMNNWHERLSEQYSLSKIRDKPHHTSLKRASVLVVINENLETLITQRADHLRSFPGQCCFPGGKRDESDENDVDTAIREAQEEVGLDRNHIAPLARLESVESPNGLCVTTIVATTQQDLHQYPLVLNTEEVQAAFLVPLRIFLEPPVSSETMTWSGEEFTLRHFRYATSNKTYDITGLTAYIAHRVAGIVLEE